MKISVGVALCLVWVAFVLGIKFGEWGAKPESQAKARAAGVATRQFVDKMLGKD